MQATCRSLIVDTLPESQQQIGSAWGEPESFFEQKRLLILSKLEGCSGSATYLATLSALSICPSMLERVWELLSSNRFVLLLELSFSSVSVWLVSVWRSVCCYRTGESFPINNGRLGLLTGINHPGLTPLSQGDWQYCRGYSKRSSICRGKSELFVGSHSGPGLVRTLSISHLPNVSTHRLDFDRMVSFLWSVSSVSASHLRSDQKLSLNSLRYNLGWRDILPPECRQRRGTADNWGHSGWNR